MYISRPQILGLFDRIEIPQPTLFRHNEIRGGDNSDNDGEASQTAGCRSHRRLKLRTKNRLDPNGNRNKGNQ